MRQNSVTVILGKKGSGKSTQAKKLWAEASRRVCLDRNWEYDGGVVVRDFASFVAYVSERGREKFFSVIVRTRDDEERDKILEFFTAADDPEQAPLPGTLVVVEEADTVWGPMGKHRGFSDLVNVGRHFQVSLVAISRRPRRLNRDVTANADELIIGRMQEPADREYLRELVGDRIADAIETLGEHDFVTWRDGEDGERGPTDVQDSPGRAGGVHPADGVGSVPQNGAGTPGGAENDRGGIASR